MDWQRRRRKLVEDLSEGKRHEWHEGVQFKPRNSFVRVAGRNVETMWLLGRLAPDHKTIADFRKDNGAEIRKVCARFVALCRRMGLLKGARVAVDGSKFKAVNTRDRNFTQAKMARR